MRFYQSYQSLSLLPHVIRVRQFFDRTEEVNHYVPQDDFQQAKVITCDMVLCHWQFLPRPGEMNTRGNLGGIGLFAPRKFSEHWPSFFVLAAFGWRQAQNAAC